MEFAILSHESPHIQHLESRFEVQELEELPTDLGASVELNIGGANGRRVWSRVWWPCDLRDDFEG